MRLARKLFLLGIATVAALALTAGSAAAQIEVDSEPGGEGCGEVTVDAHVVSGGCHVEAESIGVVTLSAYVPAKVVLSVCEVYTEGQVGGDGSGYITEALLTPPSGGGSSCTRRPCNEDAGAEDPMVPWPAHIAELGSGEEAVEATFCLQPVVSAEGSAGTICTVHLPLFHLGNHDWEVGDSSEYFCEPGTQVIPVSIEGDFTTVAGGERAEVLH